MIGVIGVVILAVGGFVAASLLRPSEPAVAELPSATASATASPTSEATGTGEPTASPEPTPEPTPAGPPREVAVGGWASVVVDELNVRAGPATDAASNYLLLRGAVAHVAEGPTVAGGFNWYRITSLGGASGWASSGRESEPYLETMSTDPRLSGCGQVRGQVVDTSSGSPAASDPLRVGEFALPAAGFDDRSLGVMELLRGMGQEVCFTARLGADGLPELSTELNASACGHGVAAGAFYRLEPTDDDGLALASQVMDSTVVHPALLDGGPTDNRMSSNLRTIMGMLANDGTSGCVNMTVTQRARAVDAYRSVSARQCSIVELYDQFSLKLKPASGGPTAWIALTGSDFQPELFQVGQRVSVSVDASAGDRDRWAGAWPIGDC